VDDDRRNGMQTRRRLFPSAVLLAAVDDDAMGALAAGGAERRFPTGAYVARQGEAGDSFHVVLHGSVRISVDSADGDEATLAILGRGESFGELSLLDGEPRSANAIANEPTATLRVSRTAFDAWLSDYPAVARDLLAALCRRLRATDAAMADFTLSPLPQRVARRLVDLAAVDESDLRRDTAPRIRITQHQLASMLGVSREHLNRELKASERRGWLRLGRGFIELLDADALLEAAGR
jgi:CRP/FNR family cyclic AMP-dependent transcriptional regulator